MGILIQRFILDLRLVEHRLGHWSDSPSQLKTNSHLGSMEFVSTPSGLSESSSDCSIEVNAGQEGGREVELKNLDMVENSIHHSAAAGSDPEAAFAKPKPAPQCLYNSSYSTDLL